MTLQLLINKQDIAPLLSSFPTITDDINGVCRSLDFTLQAADGLVNYLGQAVHLYLGGVRWFFGFMEVRGWQAEGQITYKVYDPLYFLKKNPRDYYFKNQTATQMVAQVLKETGVKAGTIANTGAVLAPKLLQKAEGDKAIIDALARTYAATKKKYWLRFNPTEGPGFGATVFERVTPKELWAFQRGVNMINATYTESLEEHYNMVRLVNRDTGKTVTKKDSALALEYGARTYFEEVDKDAAATMERDATALLTEKKKIKTTVTLEGFNPGLSMPQFFSGDVIFVEEDMTQLFGAYHIRSVTQTIQSSKDIMLSFDLQDAPDIPAVQFDDATTKEKEKKAKGKKAQAAKDKKAKDKKDKDAESRPGNYSPEMKAAIEKYGT